MIKKVMRQFFKFGTTKQKVPASDQASTVFIKLLPGGGVLSNNSEKHILLVEDEAIVAMAESNALEKCGYAVTTVHSGEQAVDAVNSSGDIDLVLMDIDLGRGMDGTQAAEIILQNHDLPVVFLSSHSDPETVEKTEGITSYGYVVKNSSITVLDASIKMAFRLFTANTTLRRNEERFRLLTENARDLIYRVELVPKQRFSYVSPASTQVTGYTPEDHYADPDLGFKLVHPEDRGILSELIQSGNAFKEPVILRWCRKDGEVIWTEQNNVPIYNSDGSIVAIEGIARDITDRKELEENLHESNRRLSAFLQISKAVTVPTDMQALLQLVVDSTAEVTNLKTNAIYLMNGGGTIQLAATTPPIPENFPDEFRVSELCDHPHIKQAIDTRQSVLLPDTAVEKLTPAEQEVVQLRNLRTILFVPIHFKDKALGVLILSSIGEVHTFKDEEITLLHGFADQIAGLIEHTTKCESEK